MEYMPITTPTSNSSGNNSSSAVCGGLADVYRIFTFGNTMTMVGCTGKANKRGHVCRWHEEHVSVHSAACL